MSNLHSTDISKFYLSLDEAREDGLTPVKCTSLLCFYKLKGKTSVINKANLEPITYLEYIYFSPLEERYYYKCFSGYSVEDFFFFKPLLDFGQNELITQLRERILNGHGVWLLFKKEQITSMNDMLIRVWNANRSDKGKLKYQDWLRLAELSLKQEDYIDIGKNLTGYKTICNQFALQIQEFWKTVTSNSK